MGLKAGALLWNRQRITLSAGITDVDTGLTQVNKSFGNQSPGEPTLGVSGLVAALPDPANPSRIHVIPLAPTNNWTNVAHGEPYFNTTTQTVHVVFTNSSETSQEINVLFWNPHTIVGPGEATTYTAPFDPSDLFGVASPFFVLAGSTITNTATPTALTGDLGLSPGVSVTGFPPGTVTGTQHITDGTAAAAQVINTAAYLSLQAQIPTQVLTGTDLGGLTLPPGVYFFASSAQLTGVLTLDAQGDPNATWVFQMGTTLTTASGSSVVVINGGTECNAFFAVGSSATLGTTTAFKGNILALASITLNTGASIVHGRAWAQTGAVTFDDNIGSVATCV